MDNYDPNQPQTPENPLSGLDQIIGDAMIEKVVQFTCRKIATSRDRRSFADIYKYFSSLPIKAVLQMPKPLLDEFWKFVDAICQEDPTDNAAHGLKSMIEGATALLNAEDQFQQDFHGMELTDLLEDYEDRMSDLADVLRRNEEAVGSWAEPAFRRRKKLPMSKGQIPEGDEDETPHNNDLSQ